ncbi:MAG: hypothetical protein Q9163_001378, partial [Psora crenata]
MQPSPTSANPALTLIIRFSASIPDLPLPISSPETTFPSTLSTIIRPQLPADLTRCSLRYIYAGALLRPKVPLSSILRLENTPQTTHQKFYIHCSISTTTRLSPAELEDEAAAASRSLQEAISTTTTTSSGVVAATDGTGGATGLHSPHQQQRQQQQQHQQQQQPPPPQGFDRLLSAGFTPTEVASLRSQFLALHAHTHTPDTMPSPAELRLLEDRWLDSNNYTNNNNNNNLTGTAADADVDGDGTLAGG